MGQYYRIVLKDRDNTIKSYDPIDGYKLMEFSWSQLPTVSFICKQLETPKRVYVVGDYASDSDNKNTYPDGNIPIETLRSIKPTHCEELEYDYKEKWVFNITKGVCFAIFPNSIFNLFLLCSIGNGYGGGDYEGINQEHVGTWYGDMIVIRPKTLEDFKNYNECSGMMFDEC